MILPTKYITSEQALIGVGATILQHLDAAKTVSILWYEIQGNKNIGTFQNYVLGLCFLKSINAIEFQDNFLSKVISDVA